jgi:hypothetical protein
MTSAETHNHESGDHSSRRHCGSKWSGGNIAATAIGLILFWPIGVFILFWVATGRKLQQLPVAIREKWEAFGAKFERNGRSSHNVVFDEYQQTQYDRIRELKAEIKTRSKRFNEFRADAKRRADEEEFNRFMDGSSTAQ